MTERSLAIIGPGLLGGSLLHDAKRLGWEDLRAYARRAEAVRELAALGLASVVSSDLKTVVADASIIILASPVGTYSQLARELTALPLAKDVVVTDVGSVKGMVMDGAGRIFQDAGIPFIGSHPMAGSEAKGLRAARERLYEGASCILTIPDYLPPDSAEVRRIEAFWQGLGCRISHLDAAKHDEVVAKISHMPHLAAVAVTLAALEKDASVAKFAAGGLRDTTRVASGDPAMWREILAENRRAVIDSCRDLARSVAELLEILENLDDERLLSALTKAKDLRDSRYSPPPASQLPS